MAKQPYFERCTECGWSYPEDVTLSPVIGSQQRGVVCGICALEIVNAIHGTRMKRFHGEQAEHARQDALAARRNGTARKLPATTGARP